METNGKLPNKKNKDGQACMIMTHAISLVSQMMVHSGKYLPKWYIKHRMKD